LHIEKTDKRESIRGNGHGDMGWESDRRDLERAKKTGYKRIAGI
jgi:hypothetical protein